MNGQIAAQVAVASCGHSLEIRKICGVCEQRTRVLSVNCSNYG